MGRAIEREFFTEQDYDRFEVRLDESLESMAELLARPCFGIGPMTMGAELEVHLVDAAGRPRPVNHEVVEAAHDERVTVEIAKYNVEVNTRPAALTAHAFQFLASELEELLASVRRAAALHGARAVPIGILPTVERAHLDGAMMTDAGRYRAMDRGIRRLRRGPGTVRIGGRNGGAVDLVTESVVVAGVNTSFQIQLRVSPRDFPKLYNAAQLATAPALAASANSPMFLGQELWDETRISLFAQGFETRPDGEDWRPARVSLGDGWCKTGILELFEESVAQHSALLPLVTAESPRRASARHGIPALEELRLHQGTVWRWNRAVYDHACGGHVRIEMRALPAGPTVIDMLANAAFIVGLTLGLAPDTELLTSRMTFAHAVRNLVEAGKYGLDAELVWPCSHAPSPHLESARALIQRLLPIAHRGLASAGVANDEAEPLLSVIEARVASRQTGAAWQRERYRSHLARSGAEVASGALVESYLALSQQGRPVHEWSP
jgi:gamma-glutamyl:cysteine ligase YbdK (ATP-grasp superfamily)